MSGGGVHTSENAGMSSENEVRILMAESLRFLEEGSSAPSKSEAKVRLKSVAAVSYTHLNARNADMRTAR